MGGHRRVSLEAAEERHRAAIPDLEDVDLSQAQEALAAVEHEEERAAPSYAETLLEDGQVVEVQLARVEVGRFGDRLRWFAHFVICEEDILGQPILRTYNAPKPGRRLGPSHNLAADYAAVTGLRPPPIPNGKKPERFLELFLRGVRLMARTRVVDQQMDTTSRKWTTRPEATRYSVINGFGGDGIPTVTAGCPFVCRGRKNR